jgi:putative tricarboxylic transport membrane protein
VIRPSLYLLTLPTGMVMPTVILLALVGTFAEAFSMFDVGVMFGSGIFGYLLLRNGYPFAPLILGVILGPMADQNLRRALWIYEGKLEQIFLRPLGDLLILAVIWSFYYGIRRSRQEARRLAEERRAEQAIQQT